LRQTVIARRQMLLMGAQADILEKQKAISRLQFITTHRPVIKVRYFRRTDIANHQPVDIRFATINGGDGEATNVCVRATIELMKEPPLPPPMYLGVRDIDGRNKYAPGTSDDHIVIANFSGADVDPARMEGRCLYVYGYIVYSDSLGEGTRTTAFCRMWDKMSDRFIPVDDPDWEYSD
jgi:hypothetical protein